MGSGRGVFPLGCVGYVRPRYVDGIDLTKEPDAATVEFIHEAGTAHEAVECSLV